MNLQQWKKNIENFPLFLKCKKYASSLAQKWREYTFQQVVGLDLGTGFIKLLQINTKENPYRIEAFGIIPLPAGAIVKEEIKNPVAIGLALETVFDETQVEVKNVALAISRSSTIIKNITVDKRLNSADIESRAWVEANHHFPDLVGDIYLDFSIVEPTAQDKADATQHNLLLVACRKDQVKPYLELIKDNGLIPRVVDVNSYALERSLALIIKRSPELKTAALLSLDFNLSSLIVVHENQLVYAHDHSFDGLHFINRVQEYLNADESKAAELKTEEVKAVELKTDDLNATDLKPSAFEIEAPKVDELKPQNLAIESGPKGSLSDPKYVEILKAEISAHFRHALHFFYSSRPHISIQQIILAGDCANIPFLDAFIQQEAGIETRLADPFVGMSMAPQVDQAKLQQHAPALMLCCGLALSTLERNL